MDPPDSNSIGRDRLHVPIPHPCDICARAVSAGTVAEDVPFPQRYIKEVSSWRAR